MKAEIYGARVLTNGAVIDTNGIELIAHEFENRYQPKLCRGPGNPQIQYLLTFSGYYPPLGVYKALGAFYYGLIAIAETSVGQKFPSLQIFPNPIKTKGYLTISLPADAKVDATLYSVDGRMAKSLFNGRIKAGSHSIPITTENLPNGIYFVNIKTGEKRIGEKLLILKD